MLGSEQLVGRRLWSVQLRLRHGLIDLVWRDLEPFQLLPQCFFDRRVSSVPLGLLVPQSQSLLSKPDIDSLIANGLSLGLLLFGILFFLHLSQRPLRLKSTLPPLGHEFLLVLDERGPVFLVVHGGTRVGSRAIVGPFMFRRVMLLG